MDFKPFNWQRWVHQDGIIKGGMAISKPEWREARKERNWAVQVVQTVRAENSLLVVGKDMALKVR